MDATDPVRLAGFWMTALDYVEALPAGWLGFVGVVEVADQGVPPNELADGATITDPAGVGPRITFLRVPEPKSAKTASISISRASGGRHLPPHVRRQRIDEVVEMLSGFGRDPPLNSTFTTATSTTSSSAIPRATSSASCDRPATKRAQLTLSVLNPRRSAAPPCAGLVGGVTSLIARMAFSAAGTRCTADSGSSRPSGPSRCCPPSDCPRHARELHVGAAERRQQAQHQQLASRASRPRRV